MKKTFLIIAVLISLILIGCVRAQYDPPSFYTTYFKLRCWSEGDRPGADSVNQNLIDIDLHLHNIKSNIHDSLVYYAKLNTENHFTGHDNFFDCAGHVWFYNYPALDGTPRTYSQLYNNEFTTKSHLAFIDSSLTAQINSVSSSFNGVAYLGNGNVFTQQNTFNGGVFIKDAIALYSDNQVILSFLTPKNTIQFTNGKDLDTILSFHSNAWHSTKGFYIPSLQTTGDIAIGGLLSIGNLGNEAIINFLPNYRNKILFLNNISDTLLAYYGGVFTTSKTFDAHGYKENGSVGHLASTDTPEITSFWISISEGGTATVQLQAVPVTINGITYYLLKWEKPEKKSDAKPKR